MSQAMVVLNVSSGAAGNIVALAAKYNARWFKYDFTKMQATALFRSEADARKMLDFWCYEYGFRDEGQLILVKGETP